jgi:2-dehydro-3-deoxyphosphogluconate aldolase/(4S)-4-hydroxy-2-oxoglutarate aldolase
MLGALTPTEVLQAWRAGADYVKVFPCSALGGAEYLKALQGPLPNIRIMPTGGVHLETLLSYKRAGAAVLGVGTALADHSLLASQGEAALVELTKKYVERFAQAT